MRNTVLTKEPKTLKMDFLRTSVLRIQLLYLVIIFPFLINHILQGRYFTALSTLIVCAICGFNVWSILSKKYYFSSTTLFGLVPAVTLLLVVLITGQGIIGMFACYCAVIAFYFMLPQRQAWLTNIAILCICVPVAWVGLELHEAISLTSTLILVSLFSAIFINVIYTQQNKLHLLAATDTLTGLLNRSMLYQSLEQAIEQSKRRNIPMTIITFDIDHFKAINDNYGHDVGDDVLHNLGNLLNQRVRRSDRVFRLGGEEFMTLLFNTDLEEGQKVAEDLRSIIASTQFLANHPVTVSLGVAALLPDEALSEWVKRSDEHLYIAKSSGRNKVIYQNTLSKINSKNPSLVSAVN